MNPVYHKESQPTPEYVSYLKTTIANLENKVQELCWEIGRLKTQNLKYTGKFKPHNLNGGRK